MARVIDFPPAGICQLCNVALRPATRDEIRADLLSPDYRHMAQAAAQGDRDFDSAEAYPDWLMPDDHTVLSPPWLLRCDKCGLRLLWHRQTEI